MAKSKRAPSRTKKKKGNVERHKEVVRQWKLLRLLEASRYGRTLVELAAEFEVHQRTIRRDMDALSFAGFPIYPAEVEGTVRWKVDREIFTRLAEGLSLAELCALYASRALVQLMAGTPFHGDLEQAFQKIENAMPRKLRDYLNDLPQVFAAKRIATKKPGRKQAAIVADLYAAILQHRAVRMRYYSFHSQRERDYVVDPYRLAFAEGGLYLFAYVRVYGQVRTFAVERIRSVALTDERFDPAPVTGDVFPESLGVNTGTPEPVVVQFTGSAALHVAERQWHKTQRLEKQPDGSVIIRLHVCVDFALQAWILSFGPLAQVLAPSRLAERIYEQLEEARDQYAPRLFGTTEPPSPPPHPELPFRRRRPSSPPPS